MKVTQGVALPKNLSFCLSFLPRFPTSPPSLLSNILLLQYKECCWVYSNSCLTLISPPQMLIQLLYHIMAGGERKNAFARILGWKAALIHCEGQTSTRKGTAWTLRALYVSLVVIQLGTNQCGVFYNLWSIEIEFPFMVVPVSMPNCAFLFPQWWSRYWHKPKV